MAAGQQPEFRNALSLVTRAIVLAAVLCGPLPTVAGEDLDAGARTVIGPQNPDLAGGAEALLAGDTERGIRLTRLGLDAAASTRERLAGLSNLCAAHLRRSDWDTAMAYCNEALELQPRFWRALVNRALIHTRLASYDAADADLEVAEEIAPGSHNVKAARALWRDATDPVVPVVIIDDRREASRADDE